MALKRKKKSSSPIIDAVQKSLGKTPSEERAAWEKMGCQGPCVSSKRKTKGEALKDFIFGRD